MEFASRYRTELTTIGWRERAPTDLDALEDMIAGSDGFDLRRLVR